MSDLTYPTPTQILDALTVERERLDQSALRDFVLTKRYLAAFQILLPAALNAAAAGNVTMKDAVARAWPLLNTK